MYIATGNPGNLFVNVKFQFIALKICVTFLCPNKKVTKEVVLGEALRANTPSPRTPLPSLLTTAHGKCPDFQRALRC